MTYPKLNQERIHFVAERTNPKFRLWMPLYDCDETEAAVWEDAELAEDAMMSAAAERLEDLIASYPSVTGLTGIAIGVAMTELKEGNLGETREEAVTYERAILETALKHHVKSGEEDLTSLTERRTRIEWKRIFGGGSSPDEAWVKREAADLEHMVSDYIRDQVGNMLWDAVYPPLVTPQV